MKLTKKKAIDLSIELWGWLAETGKEKEDWPNWERYGGLDDYGECAEVNCLCFLCELTSTIDNWGDKDYECDECPYTLKFEPCFANGAPYKRWMEASTKPTRKKYAKLFLEQLYQLRG